MASGTTPFIPPGDNSSCYLYLLTQPYRRIASKLDGETLVDTVLYLVSNYHLLCMIRDCIASRRVQVCVALFAEFLESFLATPVMIAGTMQRDIPFQAILAHASQTRGRQ